MRECWVISWLEIPEGHTDERTAVMTGNGKLPPCPKGVQGDFMTCDGRGQDYIDSVFFPCTISTSKPHVFITSVSVT